MEGSKEELASYQKIREDARVFYTQIRRIDCPAFNNESVYFTANGFHHLRYSSDGKERPRKTQTMKYKLLSKAVTLIARTTTYQEYEERLINNYRKIRQGKHTFCRYWGFVAIISGFRIKVIIRQLGNGKKEFRSIIPAWEIRAYKNIKLISNATGDLYND